MVKERMTSPIYEKPLLNSVACYLISNTNCTYETTPPIQKIEIGFKKPQYHQLVSTNMRQPSSFLDKIQRLD